LKNVVFSGIWMVDGSVEVEVKKLTTKLSAK